MIDIINSRIFDPHAATAANWDCDRCFCDPKPATPFRAQRTWNRFGRTNAMLVVGMNKNVATWKPKLKGAGNLNMM